MGAENFFLQLTKLGKDSLEEEEEDVSRVDVDDVDAVAAKKAILSFPRFAQISPVFVFPLLSPSVFVGWKIFLFKGENKESFQPSLLPPLLLLLLLLLPFDQPR